MGGTAYKVMRKRERERLYLEEIGEAIGGGQSWVAPVYDKLDCSRRHFQKLIMKLPRHEKESQKKNNHVVSHGTRI